MSAGRFGAALAMLWAAHDVADHVVQTDHQAANKASSWRAMAGHVGGYTATQVAALALLRPLGVRPSMGRLVVAVAFSAATHAFLDRRWPVAAILRRTGSGRFATPLVVVDGPDEDHRPGDVLTGPVPLHGPYLADQALHHAALTVSALILAGAP